eukprot:jgi/Mesen1/1969/ME000147S01062
MAEQGGGGGRRGGRGGSGGRGGGRGGLRKSGRAGAGKGVLEAGAERRREASGRDGAPAGHPSARVRPHGAHLSLGVRGSGRHRERLLHQHSGGGPRVGQRAAGARLPGWQLHVLRRLAGRRPRVRGGSTRCQQRWRPSDSWQRADAECKLRVPCEEAAPVRRQSGEGPRPSGHQHVGAGGRRLPGVGSAGPPAGPAAPAAAGQRARLAPLLPQLQARRVRRRRVLQVRHRGPQRVAGGLRAERAPAVLDRPQLVGPRVGRGRPHAPGHHGRRRHLRHGIHARALRGRPGYAPEADPGGCGARALVSGGGEDSSAPLHLLPVEPVPAGHVRGRRQGRLPVHLLGRVPQRRQHAGPARVRPGRGVGGFVQGAAGRHVLSHPYQLPPHPPGASAAQPQAQVQPLPHARPTPERLSGRATGLHYAVLRQLWRHLSLH